MVNFAMKIGSQVLLKKTPYPGVFEAQIVRLSANEQYVKLKITTGEEVWEEIETLELIEQLN